MDQVMSRRAQYILEHCNHLTLFSLDPEIVPIAPGGSAKRHAFHGYRLASSLTIRNAVKRREIVAELERGLTANELGAGCFEPHHGVRATFHGQSVDLVICFGCANVEIFTSAGESRATTSKFPQPLLDRLLHHNSNVLTTS
ncbi:hypothetical protein CCAX7_55280 [Capsulimonas corticalis]|uniref:Uncharacterized protein n=1 Tax=Capsulimonas corticalis TaxID=2219043 RepID=A0A402D5M0_9BACT|nr:hypothetical protein [Capsulimonas corticalis]BDI33477.1 hypothetical protein CCAX7_55280 [Capsulimonas corticalis]